jgi:hypothetical protein
MSINLFFLLIFGLLLGMFSYFSSAYHDKKNGNEIPQIELFSFSMYEISHHGIDHILEGVEGKKFDDRYVITSAKFSDNTKHLLQSIRADNVKYQDNIIALDGNVRYLREDGLVFHSIEGRYDTKKSLIQTDGAFTITQNGNRVDGQKLFYNTQLDTVSANRVSGSYNLK